MTLLLLASLWLAGTISASILTKQGVRDLGGVVPQRKRIIYTCPHVWEREYEWDCMDWDAEAPRTILRCGLCQEIRR